MNKLSLPICPNCNNKKDIYLKYNKGKFKVFFCRICQNGFTYPIPENLANYYHNSYWISKGILGKVKSLTYNFFQIRRRKWVTELVSSGHILDVGSGEGNFGKSLPKNLITTNLDASFSKTNNKHVVRRDFLKWTTDKKFNAVVFWESLEHVSHPKNYVRKASNILKEGGLIFIECPRLEGIEAKIFGESWFHLDLPRHLSHLTETGLLTLLENQNFKVIKSQNVLALEYVVWGFIASLFTTFSINITDSVKKGNVFIFIIALPLSLIALLAEVLFFILNSSPIMLVIARKKSLE